MPSSSSRTYTQVWYCDNCNDGPISTALNPYCPSCGHQRCSYCLVQMIKIRSERSS
ncbi:hypothetical protein QBC36DRAFT_294293 [Triangularia setosa]|uniref:Uncharacterized protein n=1 Tax=Triangularia setosa TaxID=2587417 RepID=A0AAN7A442_9PEZI|nr:hypothetical protein QBC36DRAFT_294293 [Podospora setosa]